MPLDVELLIKALTPNMRESLELAVEECIARRNLEVTVEHLLFSGVDVEGSDLRSLLSLVTRNSLQIELDAVLDAQPITHRPGTKPALSPLLLQLFDETRSAVSEPRGESRIRSAAVVERLVTAKSRGYLAPELLDACATLGRARRSGGLRHFSRPVASREELDTMRARSGEVRSRGCERPEVLKA
jgi:type VI secretion system protein VasG